MHTDEYPCRSPATLVSLRPVTLRPCFSASLPSACRLLGNSDWVNYPRDEWLGFRISGKQVNWKPPLNSMCSNKINRLRATPPGYYAEIYMHFGIYDFLGVMDIVRIEYMSQQLETI